MRRGLAAYSPVTFVIVSKVVPRSASVTVTLAPCTTAPEVSRTVPRMLPMSFWAKAVPATTIKAMVALHRFRKRFNMSDLLLVALVATPDRQLTIGGRNFTADQLRAISAH